MITKKYKNEDLEIICSNIYALYKTNIPLITIFELLIDLKLSSEYKKSLFTIKESVSEGLSIYESFNKFNSIYPKFFLSMINIGEKTGRITDVLKGLSLYYGKLNGINKKLISTLTYPAILIVVISVMVVVALLFVIPNFKDIYTTLNKEIPPMINSVINLSEYIKSNLFIACIFFLCWFIVVPYILFKYILNNVIKDNIYRINIVKEINEYILIIIINIIIKSGMNLSTGFQLCNISNSFGYIEASFSDINKDIILGKSLTEAMSNSGVFSRYSIVNIKLGEETGTLEERLELIEKDIYIRISCKLNKYLQLIGPILIILIGAVIVLFMLLFIMPLFEGIMG